jgi:hypothetical protein
VHPVDLLQRTGGVAGPQLLALAERRPVERAISAGAVIRVGRGRFALPAVAASLGTAHGLSGVLSHTSAARFWGWEVATPVGTVDVIVPRSRRPRGGRARDVVVRRRDLPAHDVSEPGVTTPVRTVLDIATDHPFEEALAVADSALRSRRVTRDELWSRAAGSPGRGRRRRLRVVEAADDRSDNQFESVLRALALEVGLDVVPQVSLFAGGRWVRPDLLDAGRGLALEAESFAWHGQRVQLMKDCRKYNDLSLLGLTLVRFAWEHVMLERAYTRSVLRACLEAPPPWSGARATNPGRAA